jgi:hypothetical protein
MIIFALLISAFAFAAQAEPLRIVALGDMPYGDPAEVYPPYEALIAKINEVPPTLVIHVGDTKGGSIPCTDRILAEQRAFMNRFRAPVLYSLGDNEWTDCHRKKAGAYDPFDRLRLIRETYFADKKTLGAPIPLIRDKRPEQARLMMAGVMFLTLHVTGSENGRGLTPFDWRDTFKARTKAAIEWLEASFAEAGNAEAVVIALHADMFRKHDFKRKKQKWRKGSAFRDVGKALVKAAADYGKPVLLIFGDSHEYRVFQPATDKAPNLVAMEVYGAPDMHAVEVLIEPGTHQPFRFAKIANPVRP